MRAARSSSRRMGKMTSLIQLIAKDKESSRGRLLLVRSMVTRVNRISMDSLR